MMDTKDLVKWGVWIVGACMFAAIVMLGIIAWVHDGEVATTIIQQLIGVISWGMPVLGGILTVNQVAAGFVAVKQANAGATVAVAQATTGPATPDNGPTNG